MKKSLFKTILVLLFVMPAAHAQQQQQQKATEDGKSAAIEKDVEKWLITTEYNSWFENLVATRSTTKVSQESQALYYGFGFGFEKNIYRPTWGYGIGLGYAYGNAVGGDKGGTLNYFEARVPWWSLRASPRLFYRWGSRTDFGLNVSLFYKQTAWPTGTDGDITVVTGPQLITGGFVDMRIRFNPKIEMIQSFGAVYKDTSIYWRLGLAYRL